jgi:hypothetical protein
MLKISYINEYELLILLYSKIAELLDVESNKYSEGYRDAILEIIETLVEKEL